MLGVEDVWFWSKDRAASQEFVVWAGRVLEHRYSLDGQAKRLLLHLVHCKSVLKCPICTIEIWLFACDLL